MNEVEANLFGGVRGRRCGGHHPRFVDQHVLAANDSVDSDWPYCLGDLIYSVGGGSVPSFNGSILSSLAVSRSPKGKLTTTSHVVKRDERQTQVTLHKLMGMLV